MCVSKKVEKSDYLSELPPGEPGGVPRFLNHSLPYLEAFALKSVSEDGGVVPS